MPFPPNFDGAWDNNFPPDTQLANLLGQDLRSFRVDTQQRLSLLSGTLANRPANMDAIFGSANYGIPYFATDTGQVFQWNGIAWVDISNGFFGGRISSAVAVNTNGAGQNGIVLSAIPSSALQVGTVIDIDGQILYTSGVVSTFQLLFGASVLNSFSADNKATVANFRATLVVRAAAVEVLGGQGMFSEFDGITLTFNPFNLNGTAAEPINAPIVIKTLQTSATGTLTHAFLSVRWR